jgi:transcriptional enhancer factor
MHSSVPRRAPSSRRSSPPSSPPSPSTPASAPLPNPKTQDVFQSIVKGRKSWKTLRGGEVVWPPELEAALIEGMSLSLDTKVLSSYPLIGLEQYTPDDSRETRLLGRFPMRNRFISDYIYQKTGKRRTAKQVGSRLQQLRDTCGGRQR